MPENGTTSDNFTPLTSLDWQVHVYGVATPELTQACAERKLSLEVFDWREPMRDVGLHRDVAYLVRPDGYIAIADANPARIAQYLDERGVRSLAAMPS
jgi:hypothetical protein